MIQSRVRNCISTEWKHSTAALSKPFTLLSIVLIGPFKYGLIGY